MAAYEYDDFRVRFTPRPEAGAYDIEAATPDGMTAWATFMLPLTDADLERVVKTLGRTRSVAAPTRDIGTAVIEKRVTAEELGGTLAKALLTGDIGVAYDIARNRAVAGGRGLRLRLSLADAPALLNVPWEFMYLKPTFLASQRRTPIVRLLETDTPIPPGRIDGNVHILGLIANPRGSQVLNVDDEQRKVDMALAKVRKERGVDVDWLDPATPRGLRQTLQEGNYHILHFVGHSEYRDGEGVLYLEDDDGGIAQVSTSQFVNLLGDQATLRLVVLNSCEAARTDAMDPFAGLATSIVALGIPAVVAMQFEITDDAAIAFAEELYHSLIARQDPIDAAVAEARKAVFTEVNEIEWATPVLFLRNDDGRLFTFNGPPSLPPVTEATDEVPPVTIWTTAAAPVAVAADAPTAPVEATPKPTPAPAPVAPAPMPSTTRMLPPPPPWETTSTGPSGDGRGGRSSGLKRVIAIGVAALLVIGAIVLIAKAVAGGDDDSTTETTGVSTTAGLAVAEYVNPISVRVPVRPGSTGADVAEVQNHLLRVGIDVGSDGADGDYGPVTEQAVQAFQTSRGLEATGTVDGATAAEMSEWIGPRDKSLLFAISAMEIDGSIHVYTVGEDGVVGMGSTKAGALDVHPAWQPHTNQLAFVRVETNNDTSISVVVPSSGDDPRGGLDAGLEVRTVITEDAEQPVWAGATALAYVAPGADCGGLAGCQDIVRIEVAADADLVSSSTSDRRVLSGGWTGISGLDIHPDNPDRLVVVGTSPDGSGRHGTWVVNGAPELIVGTEAAVDAVIAPDGESIGVVLVPGSIRGWGTSLGLVDGAGVLQTTTSVAQIISQADAARPGFELPAATAAEIGAIARAPSGVDAAFAFLLRRTDGSGPVFIVVVDDELDVLGFAVPTVSPLDNDRNHLNPAEWTDIVDLAW